MKKIDLVLQLMTAAISIFLGVLSFYCFRLEYYREVELILGATFLAAASAQIGGMKLKFTKWLLLLCGIIMVSGRLFYSSSVDPDSYYYFYMSLIGLVFWGGIIIGGFAVPIFKKAKKLNKIYLGAKHINEVGNYIKFYSSQTQEVYLGSVEFKNGNWQVYVTEGDAYLQYGERLFKKVEKMATRKYPNG